jgi:aminoglycoside phosphotransferase (APT) family kinase protein
MTDERFSGTTPVRDVHRFDEGRLTRWLAANVPGFCPPLRVRQFRGGQSNPTYLLETAGASYVLRRKPDGPLLKGAHAIEREARIMQALEPAGFPVPPVYAFCADATVIGTSFYVMGYVEGRIFWDATLPSLDRQSRAIYFNAMNSVIAQLHCVDWASIGLEGFGRPTGYLERQLSRLTRQYLDDSLAGRDPHMDLLIEWLTANVPRNDEATIVHGDFRIDNLIFHPTEPRVLAVLDWELSTIGNPISDFAYHLLMYRIRPLGVTGLLGTDLVAAGIPSEVDYVAAYCRRTGRTELESLDFHLSFSLFRLAAIFHGIKGRMLRGTAVSADANRMVEALPALAEAAWRLTHRI